MEPQVGGLARRDEERDTAGPVLALVGQVEDVVRRLLARRVADHVADVDRLAPPPGPRRPLPGDSASARVGAHASGCRARCSLSASARLRARALESPAVHDADGGALIEDSSRVTVFLPARDSRSVPAAPGLLPGLGLFIGERTGVRAIAGHRDAVAGLIPGRRRRRAGGTPSRAARRRLRRAAPAASSPPGTPRRPRRPRSLGPMTWPAGGATAGFSGRISIISAISVAGPGSDPEGSGTPHESGGLHAVAGSRPAARACSRRR